MKGKRKQGGLFFLFLAVFGIALMVITLAYGMYYSLQKAQGDFTRHVGELKKQCASYEEYLSSEEARSLFHLSERAYGISQTLPSLERGKEDAFLSRIFESQHLDCLFILDEELLPDGAYSQLGMHYAQWEKEVQSSAVASILQYPKKCYLARVRHTDAIYDIAVVSRSDGRGLVFCATRQEEEKLIGNYSPVKGLLASSETNLKGTLYILKGEEILASNKESGYRKKSEVREIQALEEIGKTGVLSCFSTGGKRFYGGMAKAFGYGIYAFYPAREVLSPCFSMLLSIFALFFVILFVGSLLYFRSKEIHGREMHRQNDIIRSISHIYVLSLLIDLEGKTYECLKKPDAWGDFKAIGKLDDLFLGCFLGQVDAPYREGYRSFLDLGTIGTRLMESEYAEYDWQDLHGYWWNDKLIARDREKGKNSDLLLVRKSIHKQKQEDLENQRRLEKAVENEMRANQSKMDFLRRMSHDVRTPLNVILGMLELADRKPDDRAYLKECRNKIRVATQYLLELVNDVLTLNRTDFATEVTTTFDLPFEVRKLTLVATEQAKAYKCVTFSAPAVSSSGKLLLGEPLYLRQIMMNIIANAVRYSTPGGEVRFSVTEEADSTRSGYALVHFSCEDNGIGMSREFQQRMFEPFAKEEHGASSEGLGLGLSIVQKLLFHLGGSIKVESEKGKGTRFDVFIPYRYAQELTHKEEEKSAPASSIEGVRVLLVEDNPLNMEIAEAMLSDAGAKVQKACDGKVAMDIFLQSEPYEIQVILMDIAMPVMDGKEATRQIRLLKRPDAASVPVVALSANLFEEDVKSYFEAGISAFLPKPLDWASLVATIASQIGEVQ